TGDILFSTGTNDGGIMIVSGGGHPARLPLKGIVWNPIWLPDGRHFLYVNEDAEPAHLLVASADGRDAPSPVLEFDNTVGEDPAVRLSTAGFLVFNRSGVLSLQR